MKYLQFFIAIIILLVFQASCSTLPLHKKSTLKKRISITPTAHAASDISDIEKIFGPVEKIPEIGSIPQADTFSIRQHYLEFLVVAALLWILLFYRLQKAKFQRRRHFKLDDDGVGLARVGSRYPGDLWHRLQAKTKCKIIPFPRRD